MYLCVDVCSRPMHVYVQVGIAVYVCCMYHGLCVCSRPVGGLCGALSRCPCVLGCSTLGVSEWIQLGPVWLSTQQCPWQHLGGGGGASWRGLPSPAIAMDDDLPPYPTPTPPAHRTDFPGWPAPQWPPLAITVPGPCGGRVLHWQKEGQGSRVGQQALRKTHPTGG